MNEQKHLGSDRGENLKEIIYCHVDINMVEDNERSSKWTHLVQIESTILKI